MLAPVVAVVMLCAHRAAGEELAATQQSRSARPSTRTLKTVGQSEQFDFARLKGDARALASKAYQAPAATLPKPIRNLTFDQMQAIRFKDGSALWRDAGLKFRARFFHLGLYNKVPVRIYELHNGQARQLVYDRELFDYGSSGVDGRKLPADLGFAGLQLFFHTDWHHDVAAFQGGSYFRAVSDAKQFGLSARGLAVDCGLPRPEEFPNFIAFWLERPAANTDRLNVYALLDSPSVTGAYRFEIRPGEPLMMNVDAAVYPRKSSQSWGIAPLTSMFQCGENDRRVSADFRPEIHDSDGLSLWTGAGECIWRPLTNPSHLRVNSFIDNNPRGFGLLQRDRNFDHYQDINAFYERRPNLWVEPKPGRDGQLWGRGAVRLVEIPTVDETFDNVVAFWEPAEMPRAGDELLLAYRLQWGLHWPRAPRLATVEATRSGIGGTIGQPRRYFSWRFAVDFAGGDLASLGPDAQVKPVVTASRGEVEMMSANPLTAIHGWRAMFDIKPMDDTVVPIDMRLYLRADGRALTETWLYQWTPPSVSDRKF